MLGDHLPVKDAYEVLPSKDEITTGCSILKSDLMASLKEAKVGEIIADRSAAVKINEKDARFIHL